MGGEEDRKGNRKFEHRREVRSGIKTAHTSTTSFLPPSPHQTIPLRLEEAEEKPTTSKRKPRKVTECCVAYLY